MTLHKKRGRQQQRGNTGTKSFHIVMTPVNGSWLNVAEMERSVMSRQCLGQRRFETKAEMASALDA